MLLFHLIFNTENHFTATYR